MVKGKNKMYFDNCKTCEDVKRTYRDLAKRLHPDAGGDEEAFKKMAAEYERAFNRYKDVHVNAAGDTYEKKTNETPQQFADIISKVINLDGVIIEIIGTWVWLTGNTKAYKDVIKAAGFWWSKSKSAWYWNGETEHKKHRGYYNMNELRDRWGAQKVHGHKDWEPATT